MVEGKKRKGEGDEVRRGEEEGTEGGMDWGSGEQEEATAEKYTRIGQQELWAPEPGGHPDGVLQLRNPKNIYQWLGEVS